MSTFLPMMPDVVARIKPASSYVDGPTQGPRRLLAGPMPVRVARVAIWDVEERNGLSCVVEKCGDTACVMEDVWRIPFIPAVS